MCLVRNLTWKLKKREEKSWTLGRMHDVVSAAVPRRTKPADSALGRTARFAPPPAPTPHFPLLLDPVRPPSCLARELLPLLLPHATRVTAKFWRVQRMLSPPKSSAEGHLPPALPPCMTHCLGF